MGLLTIGAFARAARLTPKALRLYDELGVLPPAAVDPESGYRLYDPAQLERAQLVARLRGIGMPLVDIGVVCGLEPAEAAVAISTFWQQVTADMAARGRAATLLVDHLTGRAATMPETNPAVTLRFAARCDIGAARRSNEDAAYASERLLAVADGGQGPGGAEASAAAIAALKPLELSAASAAELLTMLAEAVAEADRTVRKLAEDDHQPITTLTGDAVVRLPGRAGAHRRRPGVSAAPRRAEPADSGPHLRAVVGGSGQALSRRGRLPSGAGAASACPGRGRRTGRGRLGAPHRPCR